MSEPVMKRFAALDALILDALNGRNLTFTSIAFQNRIETESNRIAKPTRMGNHNGWRVVDRRLQALRKSGKIKYSRIEGWSRT